MNNIQLFFSLWVNEKNYNLSEYWFNLINKYFNNNNIYIGINNDCEHNSILLFKNYFKNCFITNNDNNINSDAAGFQSILLNNLNFLNKKYTLFAHSKCGSYINYMNHIDFINNVEDLYFNKINTLESILDNNENIGIIGYWYTNDNCIIEEYYKNLLEFDYLNYMPINGFYANTFYLVRSDIINTFIQKNINIFSKNLNVNYNRYFFESFFPKIISMMGYDIAHINNNNEIKIIKNYKKIWKG